MNQLLSRLPSIVGFGMLKEHCPDNEIKISISTNMTNLGVMLALFLTMMLAMLQQDLPKTISRNDLWYLTFITFGLEAGVRGLLMVVLFLVYFEPVSNDAAKNFAVDNLLYLGEPANCMFA